MNKPAVRKLLSDPVYAGANRYADMVVHGVFQPIVDQSTVLTAHDRLADEGFVGQGVIVKVRDPAGSTSKDSSGGGGSGDQTAMQPAVEPEAPAVFRKA